MRTYLYMHHGRCHASQWHLCLSMCKTFHTSTEHHVSSTGCFSHCRSQRGSPCHTASALSGHTRAASSFPAAPTRAASTVTNGVIAAVSQRPAAAIKAADAAVATATKAAAAATKGKEAKAYHTRAPASDRCSNSSQDSRPGSGHNSIQSRCC